MHDHDFDSRTAAAAQKGRPVDERIGFIGLGRMGAAMATNLVRAGCDVRAYVRRPERIKQFAALGLETSAEVADLFDCEIVVSMLPDERAVRDVMFGPDPRLGTGLASSLMPGAIHLSMSTISTAASSALESEHAGFNQGYVAAPVSVIPMPPRRGSFTSLRPAPVIMSSAATRSSIFWVSALSWSAATPRVRTWSSSPATR
jgi:hypothetical protein